MTPNFVHSSLSLSLSLIFLLFLFQFERWHASAPWARNRSVFAVLEHSLVGTSISRPIRREREREREREKIRNWKGNEKIRRRETDSWFLNEISVFFPKETKTNKKWNFSHFFFSAILFANSISYLRECFVNNFVTYGLIVIRLCYYYCEYLPVEFIFRNFYRLFVCFSPELRTRVLFTNTSLGYFFSPSLISNYPHRTGSPKWRPALGDILTI